MGDVPWEMGYLLNDFLHISMCMNVAYLIIMLTYFMGSQCGAIKAISWLCWALSLNAKPSL